MLALISSHVLGAVLDELPAGLVEIRHRRTSARQCGNDPQPDGFLIVRLRGEQDTHDQSTPVTVGGGVMRGQRTRTEMRPGPAQSGRDGPTWRPWIGAGLEQEYRFMCIGSAHRLIIGVGHHTELWRPRPTWNRQAS